MCLHECQVSVIPFGWGIGMARLSVRNSLSYSQCKWISIHWLIEAAESSCKLLLLKFSSTPNWKIQLHSTDIQSLYPTSDMLQASCRLSVWHERCCGHSDSTGIRDFWFQIFKTAERRKGSRVDWSQQTSESGTFLLLRGEICISDF